MNVEGKSSVTKSGNGSIKPFADDLEVPFKLADWDKLEIRVLKEVNIDISCGRGINGDKSPRVELSVLADYGGRGGESTWDVGDLIAEAFTGSVANISEEIESLEKLRSRIDQVIARLKQDRKKTNPLR